MRRIGWVLAVLLLATGIATAGFSPHWVNPVEVKEMSEKTVTMRIYSNFATTEDNVTVAVTGHLARHAELSDHQFVLFPAEHGRVSSKLIRITISAGNHTAGEEFEGHIRIYHHAVIEQREGQTNVVMPDPPVPLRVHVVESGALFNIPGVAVGMRGVFVFGGVLLAVLGGAGGYLYYSRRGGPEFVTELRGEGGDGENIEWRNK